MTSSRCRGAGGEGRTRYHRYCQSQTDNSPAIGLIPLLIPFLNLLVHVLVVLDDEIGAIRLPYL